MHRRIRAVNRALTNVTVRLFNATGRLLASKRLKRALRGRLLSVTLTAHAQLKPGTYTVSARSAGKLLARTTFKVRAPATTQAVAGG